MASQTKMSKVRAKKESIISPFQINPITKSIMTETKTLNLTIGERLAAIKLFDAFKGGLSTLATLVEDVKAFSMSEADWTKAGLVKTPSDEAVALLSPEQRATAQQTWKWNEEGQEKDIVVQEPTRAYLLGEIKKKSDAGEITLADLALVSLEKKL